MYYARNQDSLWIYAWSWSSAVWCVVQRYFTVILLPVVIINTVDKRDAEGRKNGKVVVCSDQVS